MKHSPIARLVFASDNQGKIREVCDIFRDTPISIIPQAELDISSPEETGSTFTDNALLKACFAASASGLPAIADDSGIVVDALDGRPGVRSARYAGETATDKQNVDKLLEEMNNVPDEQRGAAFHCAAVLVFAGDEPRPICVEGVWRGRILRERRGAGGFGYDPVFLDEQAGKTGAQMSREEKNQLSHRGKAFRMLKDRLLQTQPPSQ